MIMGTREFHFRDATNAYPHPVIISCNCDPCMRDELLRFGYSNQNVRNIWRALERDSESAERNAKLARVVLGPRKVLGSFKT